MATVLNPAGLLNASIFQADVQRQRLSQSPASLVKPRRHGQCLHVLSCSGTAATAEKFTSPKTGAVGEERFKEHAQAGTYWGPQDTSGGETLQVRFQTGSQEIVASAVAGENLLRVAERCGALTPAIEFCYEGTCCYCEMEVEGGGAQEVGYRSDPTSGALVRSCICPVPARSEELTVRILNEDDSWEDVL